MTPALAFTLMLAPVVPATDLPPASAINDLADAPHAGDRYRFPDSATAEAALRFNAAFVARMQSERELWPESMQHHFDAAIDEARELRVSWHHLSWAQWSVRKEWERQLDLKRLRQSIGRAAYERGELPAVVPLDRFRSLK